MELEPEEGGNPMELEEGGDCMKPEDGDPVEPEGGNHMEVVGDVVVEGGYVLVVTCNSPRPPS